MAFIPRHLAKVLHRPDLSRSHISKGLLSNVFSKNIRALSTTSCAFKNMEFKFTENKSGFTTLLPGWAFEDINIVSKDLRQTPFLRCWKVLTKLEFIREMAKPEGFIDIMKFEEGQNTYMKCVNLERVVPYEKLLEQDGKPYGYGLIIDSHVGRIGNTSFQIDNSVSAAETGEELFRSSLIYVCVNFDLQVAPLPQWFTDKFMEASKLSDFKPLRVSLGKSIVADDYDVLHRRQYQVRYSEGKNVVSHDYDVLFRSRYQIRHSEVDRFGHTNNTALLQYCADAIASAFKEKRLPEIKTPGILKNSIKKIDVDFINGASKTGDTLVASVMRKAGSPNQILCLLHSNGKLVLAQSVEYDFAETANVKL